MNHIIVTSTLAVVLLSGLAAPSHAERRPMKINVDSSLLGASVPGTGGVGGGLAIEPKIEVASHLRVGLRTAIAITGGGSIKSGEAGNDVSVGVGINVANLAKVEYSIPTGSVRPVIGFGAGLYYLISQEVNAGANTSVSQQAGKFFGVAPQVGLELGRARLLVTYNAILGADIEVNQTVGDAKTFSQDYWAVEFGMRF